MYMDVFATAEIAHKRQGERMMCDKLWRRKPVISKANTDQS